MGPGGPGGPGIPGVGGGHTGRGEQGEQQLLYTCVRSLSQPHPSFLPQSQELLSRKKRLSAMFYLLCVKDYGEKKGALRSVPAVHFIHREMMCYSCVLQVFFLIILKYYAIII